jgi:hypothetical protein
MEVHFLTYCTPNYKKSALRLIKSVKKYGLKNVHFYERHDLEKTAFYQQNKAILDLPQRAGCTLWKIYYMHHVYFKMKEGDILFYVDAGAEVIDNPQVLIDIANRENLCLFTLNKAPKNKHWTKRDAFVLMDADLPQFHEGLQANAFAQLYKKSAFCDTFLNEMLTYGKDIRIIGDFENVCGLPNFEGFEETRYDQSILAITRIKYNVPLHRDPTQFGNHFKLPKHRVEKEWLAEKYNEQPMENSDYPTLFNHHRNITLWDIISKKKFWEEQYIAMRIKISNLLIKYKVKKRKT